MKKLLILSCCLIALIYSCKKDSSGKSNPNDSTTWLTGTWLQYKVIDTLDSQNGYPSAVIQTATHDTTYYDAGGPNQHYTVSEGTMQSDTIKFVTATTGYENNTYNERTDFTYSFKDLTYTATYFQNNQNMPITAHITRLADDKFKAVVSDTYGLGEIVVVYYQKQ